MWLLGLQVTGAGVLAAALAVDRALVRRSAATRRELWVLAVAVLLVLPIARLPLAAPEPGDSLGSGVGGGLVSAITIVWCLGASLSLARTLVARRRARGWVARARPIDATWLATLGALGAAETYGAVRLHASEEIDVPITVGRDVLIPDSLLAVDERARRSILAHELAHVARADDALLLATAIVRALYWPTPLPWLAQRQLRAHIETAADDAVLAAGVPSTEYASLLVSIARDHLVRATQLGERIHALLDGARARSSIAAPLRLARVVGVALVLASVATACESASAHAAVTSEARPGPDEPGGPEAPSADDRAAPAP